MCVCVCVCVRACVHTCVRVCVHYLWRRCVVHNCSLEYCVSECGDGCVGVHGHASGVSRHRVNASNDN